MIQYRILPAGFFYADGGAMFGAVQITRAVGNNGIYFPRIKLFFSENYCKLMNN